MSIQRRHGASDRQEARFGQPRTDELNTDWHLLVSDSSLKKSVN